MGALRRGPGMYGVRCGWRLLLFGAGRPGMLAGQGGTRTEQEVPLPPTAHP